MMQVDADGPWRHLEPLAPSVRVNVLLNSYLGGHLHQEHLSRVSEATCLAVKEFECGDYSAGWSEARDQEE